MPSRHALRLTVRCATALAANGLAVTLLGFVCASAFAATAPIYKCLDRNLGIVYTDLPCKGGELLDVRAGDADPAAVARLERERDALDRSAAQRIADERRAALQGRYDTAPVYVARGDGAGYNDAADYAPFGYGYTWIAPSERRRDADARRDRRPQRQRVVPNRMPLPPR